MLPTATAARLVRRSPGHTRRWSSLTLAPAVIVSKDHLACTPPPRAEEPPEEEPREEEPFEEEPREEEPFEDEPREEEPREEEPFEGEPLEEADSGAGGGSGGDQSDSDYSPTPVASPPPSVPALDSPEPAAEPVAPLTPAASGAAEPKTPDQMLDAHIAQGMASLKRSMPPVVRTVIYSDPHGRHVHLLTTFGVIVAAYAVYAVGEGTVVVLGCM